MIADMTVCNLSPATHRSCGHAVAKFSRYFGHYQTVCTLRFFYGLSPEQAEIWRSIAKPAMRRAHQKPASFAATIVFSRDAG